MRPFAGHGKRNFNSKAITLIHVINNFDTVLDLISNLSTISSSSKPKCNHMSKANISFSKSSFLFQPHYTYLVLG